MRYKQVVIIGSNDCNKYQEEAFSIGSFIAKKGWALITGGKSGIMEEASKGAASENGLVIGILPDHNKDSANNYCDIIIPTGIGYARNMVNVLSGDVVISIAGKSGTLSELAYAWQFSKPIILCTFSGGWSERISTSPIDDREGGKVFKASALSEVYKHLEYLLETN